MPVETDLSPLGARLIFPRIVFACPLSTPAFVVHLVRMNLLANLDRSLREH
jgi:hypothetical protein